MHDQHGDSAIPNADPDTQQNTTPDPATTRKSFLKGAAVAGAGAAGLEPSGPPRRSPTAGTGMGMGMASPSPAG